MRQMLSLVGVLNLMSVLLLIPPSTSSEQPAEETFKGFGKHAAVAEAKAKAMGIPTDYDRPPKPTKISQPKYPKDAFQKKIQGTVLLMVVIDVTGRVSHAEVLESVAGLDDAALKCVKGWRFVPAFKGDQAVPFIASAPVTFRLSP